MAASYPSATKSFTTKTDGPSSTILAAHINDLQDEVVAIENDLRDRLPNGQVVFPAAQSASSDANTLDDYEEGTWTPVLTFTTAGNLSVTYAANGQLGFYTKVGRKVTARFTIVTSAFTHTTASGNLNITGLPFASLNTTNSIGLGAVYFQGVTKAGYVNYTCRVSHNVSLVEVYASGSGVNLSAVAAADMPSGGSVILVGTVTYDAAA